MRRYDIITLFPEMFTALTAYGVTGRAHGRFYTLHTHHLRDHTPLPRRQVDDRPYGGGPGMILRPEPIVHAVRAVRRLQRDHLGAAGPVLYLSPQGERFTQAKAHQLAQYPALIFLCGRYEGIDQRAIDLVVDHELSIGDYILTGGELAAMVILDALIRLLPGVLGDPESARRDSFHARLLDHPHYTRPLEYEGRRVPDVLLSGNHTAIAAWRQQQALQRTRERRPDLLSPSNDDASLP